MLTTNEAASRLGVTVQRIHQFIKGERLPAEKMGRDYIIKEDDLKLVEDRQTGRPSKHPSETTRQLNQAFRDATESEKKAGKKQTAPAEAKRGVRVIKKGRNK